MLLHIQYYIKVLLEQCTRFELAPESWQDPMQPLTPTLHYVLSGY